MFVFVGFLRDLSSAHIWPTRMIIGQSCTNALRAGRSFVGSVGYEPTNIVSSIYPHVAPNTLLRLMGSVLVTRVDAYSRGVHTEHYREDSF